jgi:hypothetical protein
MPEITAGRNPQYLRSTDNRIAGALVDGWLRKIVQASKHMLRSPRGWAIDAHALAAARSAGALGLRIEDTESGKTYLATWAALDAHGYTFDRGYGRQIALPLRYWQLEGAPAPLVQEFLFA